jgi:hypothetical protein
MTLNQLLPDYFQFYTEGRVEKIRDLSSIDSLRSEGIPNELQNSRCLGYRIFSGDEKRQLWLFLFLEPEMQYSTYAELGNIVASRTCESLFGSQGQEYFLAPPMSFQSPTVLQLAKGAEEICYREYIHQNRGASLVVPTLLMTSGRSAQGNA